MAYVKKTVVEELENAWLNNEVSLPQGMPTTTEYDLPVEVFTHAFAQLKRRDMTLAEVLDTKTFEDFNLQNLHTRAHIEGFYMIWSDLEALVAREDNVLNIDTSSGWEAGYKLALAEYVVKNGKIMLLNPDHFMWDDYFITHDERNLFETPVGVYNVMEDAWEEFAGTGHSDFFQGLTADVLYSSGVSRKVRAVGELGEIIREITAK